MTEQMQDPGVIYPEEYELVASKNSYYSARVRACLQYKRIPYVETPANISAIRRVIKLTGERVYPIVVCPDGTVLRDGCDIVEALEQRHPKRPVIPEDPLLHLVALIIEMMADEFMIETSIGFRWTEDKTAEWSKRLFGQISIEREKDPELRDRGFKNGAKVGEMIRTRVLQPEVGGNPENRPRALHVTRDILSRLDAHLQETPFLLGDRPSLADLGLINAMYGHLYRDPGEICDFLHWDCISLSLWIDHMLTAAGESDRGELYLTDSLEHVLAACAEHYPGRAMDRVRSADQHLSDAPPGTPISIITGPYYTAWRCQRLRDHFLSLPKNSIPEAERLLDKAGLLEACNYQPGWRGEKRKGMLVTADNNPTRSFVS